LKENCSWPDIAKISSPLLREVFPVMASVLSWSLVNLIFLMVKNLHINCVFSLIPAISVQSMIARNKKKYHWLVLTRLLSAVFTPNYMKIGYYWVRKIFRKSWEILWLPWKIVIFISIMVLIQKVLPEHCGLISRLVRQFRAVVHWLSSWWKTIFSPENVLWWESLMKPLCRSYWNIIIAKRKFLLPILMRCILVRMVNVRYMVLPWPVNIILNVPSVS